MKKTVYLKVSPGGDITLLKRFPYKSDHLTNVLIAVHIDIPDSVFRIPMTSVNIDLPEVEREDVIVDIDYEADDY